MPNEKHSLEARFGLPETVIFCKKCVMSNQRPSSAVEFKNKLDFAPGSYKDTIQFDSDGVCSACRFHEKIQRNKLGRP